MEERRERIGLHTEERIGWCDRGIRARQFKATSFGREGIKIDGSDGLSEVEEVEVVVVVVGGDMDSGGGGEFRVTTEETGLKLLIIGLILIGLTLQRTTKLS